MLPLCSAGNSTFLFPVSSLLQKSYLAIAWTFILNQQQWHVFIYTKSLFRSTVKAILSSQESLIYCLWKDNFALKISYYIQFSLPNPGLLNKLVIFTISSGKKSFILCPWRPRHNPCGLWGHCVSSGSQAARFDSQSCHYHPVWCMPLGCPTAQGSELRCPFSLMPIITSTKV